MSESAEFRTLLSSELSSELTPEQIERLVSFREEVVAEDEMQNLTRLLSPRDFLDGHVLDVIHLKKSGVFSLPALDLGAGMGVPGLLYALVYGLKDGETVISCDSERMKAEFSQRMIEKFEIKGASAASLRAEQVLDTHEVDTVIARAVGPVTRIYNWLKVCSTWNKLVLLKGPKWDEEWKEFKSSPARGKLQLGKTYRYEVGAEKKTRVIVEIFRS